MHPTLTAFLSFLWPGLGQAYRGERNRALGQAMPVIVAVAATVLAIAWLGSLVVVAYLFNPAVSLSLIAVVAALGAWRAWSIVDALHDSTALLGRPRHAIVAILLITAVVVTHGWVGWSLFSFYRAGQQIYEPIAGVTPTPTPPTAPTDQPTLKPGETTRPTPTPSPTQPSTPLPGANERVTILFVGVDNTHGPERGLTDTLIVASFDPRTNSLAMISLPRDTARLPYYDGGQWRARINSLMQAATRDPERFPDGPMGTLVNEMSYLVGIPIDYFARIDIGGFTRLIDLVGGIDVTLDYEINDTTYQFSPTEIGFHLLPGRHHLDGKLATAYARSRHGGTDYQRAARQQQILLALRSRLNDPWILTNLPALLEATSEIVRTDAPLDRLPDIVSIVARSDRAGTENIVLAPPDYAGRAFSDDGAPTSMTELRMDAVAELSIRLFGDDSRYAR